MATCPKCRGDSPTGALCPGCTDEPADVTPPPAAAVACLVVAADPAAATATPSERGPDTVMGTLPNSAVVAAGGGSSVAAVTPPPAPPPVAPKLVVVRGQHLRQEYPVYDGRNTVGRFADRPVDIDLTGQEPEGQVWSSRLHAAVTFGRGVVAVEDLNSLNGTWVNGTRIPPGTPRVLKAGDVILIGTVQLRLAVG